MALIKKNFIVAEQKNEVGMSRKKKTQKKNETEHKHSSTVRKKIQTQKQIKGWLTAGWLAETCLLETTYYTSSITTTTTLNATSIRPPSPGHGVGNTVTQPMVPLA